MYVSCSHKKTASWEVQTQKSCVTVYKQTVNLHTWDKVSELNINYFTNLVHIAKNAELNVSI